MKILSIDVGIKNLAFCLFNIKNNECEIEKWDVINLCTLEKEKCDECNNNALYEKNNILYCSKHAKKEKKYIIPKYTEGQLQKKRHSELLDYYIQINNLKKEEKIKKTKNELLQLIKLNYSENCFNNIKIVKASEIDLIQVGINMKKKFDDEFKKIKIDKILKTKLVH